VTIERSTDYALIAAVANDPSVYRMASDDFSPMQGSWKPTMNEQIHYLVAHDKGTLLGLCAFIPENAVCWQAHLCFLPAAYGKLSLQAFGEMLNWMWQHTKAQRIVGQIPLYNSLAINFVRKVGFKQFGMNPQSWGKGGKLWDRVCLGITRPQWA
jgi:RimJ/RimL family protein N-acetyltransferase